MTLSREQLVRLSAAVFLIDLVLRIAFANDYYIETGLGSRHSSAGLHEHRNGGMATGTPLIASFLAMMFVLILPRKAWYVLWFVVLIQCWVAALFVFTTAESNDLNNAVQSAWALCVAGCAIAATRFSYLADRANGGGFDVQTHILTSEPVEVERTYDRVVRRSQEQTLGAPFDADDVADLLAGRLNPIGGEDHQAFMAALVEQGLIDDANATSISIEAQSTIVNGQASYILRNPTNGREVRYTDLDAVPPPLRSYFSLGG